MRERVGRKPNVSDDAFYNIIPDGKENALTYQDLIERGYSNREIRDMASVLTCDGRTICNHEDGKGFFKPTREEDFEIMEKLTHARLKTLSRKLYAIRKAKKEFMYASKGLVAEDTKTL